jgi:hypothetical protein
MAKDNLFVGIERLLGALFWCGWSGWLWGTIMGGYYEMNTSDMEFVGRPEFCGWIRFLTVFSVGFFPADACNVGMHSLKCQVWLTEECCSALFIVPF